MSLQIGIVGLPNVGKSTLFKALTKKQVEASNYPFCTIDPNVGVVPVPDERLDKLAKMSTSKQVVPTTIEFVDIAGLVKGAHKGEGLGNKFLANIREVDAIAHVIRDFEDKNITHVHGQLDPKTDAEVINLELIMADLEVITKSMVKLDKKIRGNDKDAAKEKMVLEKIKTALEQEKMASSVELNMKEEYPLIRHINLLTLKPVLNVINIAEDKANDYQQYEKDGVIAISAKIEAELSELTDADAAEMMQELGLKESGLNRLIKASYKLLDLVSFLTTGEKESRAWTIRQGAKAPEAAGVIHSDFEEKFIRAEVINWQELLDVGSWAAAREKGLIKMEGKEYVFQDGDVTEFHHS